MTELTNRVSIYQLICELYKEHDKNPNIKVSCIVETAKNNYYGTFVFDENNVIFDRSLTLCNVCVSQNMFEEMTMFDKSCFNFDSIVAFSYKITNNKVTK